MALLAIAKYPTITGFPRCEAKTRCVAANLRLENSIALKWMNFSNSKFKWQEKVERMDFVSFSPISFSKSLKFTIAYPSIYFLNISRKASPFMSLTFRLILTSLLALPFAFSKAFIKFTARGLDLITTSLRILLVAMISTSHSCNIRKKQGKCEWNPTLQY